MSKVFREDLFHAIGLELSIQVLSLLHRERFGTTVSHNFILKGIDLQSVKECLVVVGFLKFTLELLIGRFRQLLL